MTRNWEELDAMNIGAKLGVSETSGIFHVEKINQHPAKKIIIDRPLAHINASLERLNLPKMEESHVELLRGIRGHRIQFNKLFSAFAMQNACEHLGVPFNQRRFDMLAGFNVQNTKAIEEVRGMVP
jgi:hypothetical protein